MDILERQISIAKIPVFHGHENHTSLIGIKTLVGKSLVDLQNLLDLSKVSWACRLVTKERSDKGIKQIGNLPQRNLENKLICSCTCQLHQERRWLYK
ncbi:hypothetical protein JW865_08425 [Candidatus Bathyarchaeota archaeon]|nr:hypothetical protein [Candidatus Bathyarchaeota archaeon]